MFKKLKLFAALLLCTGFNTVAQQTTGLLQEADSLFKEQQFTQSFILYDSLYTYYKEVTPAMLLKMAYIKEGLNDITSAQYYLNEYYLATKNEQALQKMEDLANANNLSGYQHNDFTFFFSLYYKNYNWLLIGVISLSLLLLGMMIYQRKKYKIKPWLNGFFLITLLAMLFALVNFGRDYNRGVIIKNNTYVMSAPSSGANLIDVLTKGHKVEIDGKKDVWYQIEWNGEEAYIKAKNVKLLTVW